MEFTINDLNDEQKELAELIGLDAFNKLVYYYGGTSIYVPKTDTIERQKRNTRICEDYRKGKSLKYLSTKYGLTENQIRSILGDVYVKKSNHILAGQLSIFDDLL
ncbi:Mor transcription activator family protein [Thomasclavelia ramosa]|uniref:Mor transcription activator family protein n=1 Tax=Thomasclavelia ramosa TaxID=1547 RepID=UPI0036F1A9E7